MADLDHRAAGGRRLKDKVCIVTGAGQGIGRAAAKRLGAEGGIVVVADRVDEGATQTMAELNEHGVTALKVLADLGTFAGAQELINKTVAAYGRIDVLVNNVGGTTSSSRSISTPRTKSSWSWSVRCIRPCGAASPCCRS